MSTIGFVGPGVMGAPMITNLVRNGHQVRGLGRSPASRERLHSTGAVEASDLAEVADGAEVVITMVPDSPDVRSLVLGDGGLAQVLRPGQIFIDMSTIAPAVSVQIHDQLIDRDVPALDAPVSGGEAAAIDGTLSIMVGGNPAVLDMVRPLLGCVGTTITHVGPAGSGQLTKAANQLIVAANLQAVSEAVIFLEKSGVDLEPALEAIGGGLAGSTVLDRKRQNFLNSDFTPGFRVALHHKDLGIVGRTMQERGIALPMTALVAQLMAALNAGGSGDLDHSGLLKLIRSLNSA